MITPFQVTQKCARLDVKKRKRHQALSLPGNEILVGQALTKFDEKGSLIDEKTIVFIDKIMKKFIVWIDTTKQWQEEEI